MTQAISAAGNGNIIVQIQGDGNSILTGLPHLKLTRRMGLANRIQIDPDTGLPFQTDVIRPFSRSIDMVGREKDLEDLRAWLDKEKPISVRVLTGAAGYGKTRLALELIEQMAALGWHAGFLTKAELERFRQQRDLARWGWNAPTLAVVDYASASARDLHAWLRELEDHDIWQDARAGEKYPLRLMLVERHAQAGVGWWADVFGTGADAALLEKLADPAEPVHLRPLDDVNHRRAIIEKTLERLGSVVTLPPPGEDTDFDSRLSELTWAGIPLLLMLAAATAAHEGFGQVLAMGSDDLAFSVAETELARICKVVESKNISNCSAQLVKHVAAVATLCQGLTSDATKEVIERESKELGYNLPHGSAVLRDALAVALPNEAGGIAAVEPNMIGEALLLDVWREDNNQALAAISRAYAAEPDTVAKTVIRTCQDYVIRGHRHPLKWLEHIRADSTDLYALIHLAEAMPASTLKLREVAVEVETTVLARVHALTGDLRELDRLTILASSFNNLSNHFSALGQREKALAAIKETVLLDSELTKILPETGMPKLASSLNNLSNRFSDLGQWEDALAAIEKALAISRDLAASRPDTFRPDLANCLNGRSICLHSLGRYEEAVDTIYEAVAIRRDLVTSHSDTFRSELGSSLLNLSTYLSSLGRGEEALAGSEEAAKIGRDLAAAKPDAFRPRLPVYLNNLSNHLSRVGRHDEALTINEELVTLVRDLEGTHPDTFRPDLAKALVNQSNRFFDLDRSEEGLAAIEEGVALYRDLASTYPDTFRRDLAKALNNLSLRFLDVGRQNEALDVVEEAVAALQDLFLARPMAFEQLMDTIVSNYSDLCRRIGSHDSYPAPWTPILETLHTSRTNQRNERRGGTNDRSRIFGNCFCNCSGHFSWEIVGRLGERPLQL